MHKPCRTCALVSPAPTNTTYVLAAHVGMHSKQVQQLLQDAKLIMLFSCFCSSPQRCPLGMHSHMPSGWSYFCQNQKTACRSICCSHAPVLPDPYLDALECLSQLEPPHACSQQLGSTGIAVWQQRHRHGGCLHDITTRMPAHTLSMVEEPCKDAEHRSMPSSRACSFLWPSQMCKSRHWRLLKAVLLLLTTNMPAKMHGA